VRQARKKEENVNLERPRRREGMKIDRLGMTGKVFLSNFEQLSNT
jgi:hypothetical protein